MTNLELGEVYNLNGVYNYNIKVVYLGKKRKKGLQEVLAGINPNSQKSVLIYFNKYKIKENQLELTDIRDIRALTDNEIIFGDHKDYYQANYIKELLNKKGIYEKQKEVSKNKIYSIKYKGNILEGVILNNLNKRNFNLILLNISPESKTLPMNFSILKVKNLEIKNKEIFYSNPKILKLKEKEQEYYNEFGKKYWEKDL